MKYAEKCWYVQLIMTFGAHFGALFCAAGPARCQKGQGPWFSTSTVEAMSRTRRRQRQVTCYQS